MGTITPEQYRGYLTLEGLADNTIRTYSSFYTRWHGHPGGPDWTTDTMWTPQGVRAWSRTLPQSRSSLEQARNAIVHACRAAGVDELLAKAVVIPRTARKRRSRALTMDEAHRLHDVAENAGVKGLAVLVGLYAAARRSETACLEWANVDLAGREITLVRPKNRDTLTLHLHPVLHHHLSLHHVRGQRWVFPGQWGGHIAPSTIGTWVSQVAEEAGVERVTSHRLRHTALTEINDRTRDLRAAQEVAGHQRPETTALYTRAGQRRVQQAIEALDYGTAA